MAAMNEFEARVIESEADRFSDPDTSNPDSTDYPSLRLIQNDTMVVDTSHNQSPDELPPYTGEVLVGERYVRFPYMPNTPDERAAWNRTAADIAREREARRPAVFDEAAWKDYQSRSYATIPRDEADTQHGVAGDFDLPSSYHYDDLHANDPDAMARRAQEVIDNSGYRRRRRQAADVIREIIGPQTLSELAASINDSEALAAAREYIRTRWRKIIGPDGGFGPLMSEKVWDQILRDIRAQDQAAARDALLAQKLAANRKRAGNNHSAEE